MPNIVGTHTDSDEVFIWNWDTQPKRNCGVNAFANRPDVK